MSGTSPGRDVRAARAADFSHNGLFVATTFMLLSGRRDGVLPNSDISTS